ncbi:MAG TPA: hypothetical protein VF294_05150 [Polyangiaceae bacterium]
MATSEPSKPQDKRAAGQTAVKPPAETRTVSRRPSADELPQAIGGRFLVAALILAALTVIPMSALGNLFEPPDPPPTDTASWQTGAKSTIRLTLVTADAASLTCASSQSFENRHCAFKTENEAWPREAQAPLDDNKANIIQPYRTWLDNKLILVAGVWAQPSLAMRVHNEPPGNLAPDKLARFVAECKVHFGGSMEKPMLRWQPGQSWGSEQATMVAIVDSCQVIDEPSPDCPSGLVCSIMKLF